jgi:tetratricopeptide (TPR) repeat protein
MAYAVEGANVEAARVLLSLGLTFNETGEFDRAIETTWQACEVIQQVDDAKLNLAAHHNLAFVLLEAGRTAEAREVFSQISSLYESSPDAMTQLRRLWLEADLAHAEGDAETAEDAYKAVRDGFLALRIGYDAALAALDLALLYAEQGRTAELKRVAEEIVPVFESQDVHREAATALMLFQDAVRTEQVTLRYLVELSRYLERARHDPTLAFHTPT